MISHRFGRPLGAMLLLAPSLAFGQSALQQPATSGSADTLPLAINKLYQNDLFLQTLISTRISQLGAAAFLNVGTVTGTVADGGALASEAVRAQTAEAGNATAVANEITRAMGAEAALQAAIAASGNAYAVNYTAQSLSGAQQLQARQNIAAVTSGDSLTLGSASTATTQAAGDSTTKVATTAFATGALTSYASTVSATYATTAFVSAAIGASAQSLGANGYKRLPGGVTIQWGVSTPTNGDQAFSFPIAFSATPWAVICTPESYGATTGQAFSAQADGLSATYFGLHARFVSNGGSVGTAQLPVRWIAIGPT